MFRRKFLTSVLASLAGLLGWRAATSAPTAKASTFIAPWASEQWSRWRGRACWMRWETFLSIDRDGYTVIAYSGRGYYRDQQQLMAMLDVPMQPGFAREWVKRSTELFSGSCGYCEIEVVDREIPVAKRRA